MVGSKWRRIDAVKLRELVSKRARILGMAMKDVQGVTGVSAASLSRLGRGCQLDAAGFLVLCRWAGVDPMSLLVEDDQNPLLSRIASDTMAAPQPTE